MKKDLRAIILAIFVLLAFSAAGFAQDINTTAAVNTDSGSVAKTKKQKKNSKKNRKHTKRTTSTN